MPTKEGNNKITYEVICDNAGKQFVVLDSETAGPVTIKNALDEFGTYEEALQYLKEVCGVNIGGFEK